VAFFTKSSKKGARKFFSRFQEPTIELFTFPAVRRDKSNHSDKAAITFGS